MFSKIDVNGPQAHPVYQFLRLHSSLWNSSKSQAEVIPWNFAKFIVNAEGQVVSYHGPRDNPLSLQEKIEALL